MGIWGLISCPLLTMQAIFVYECLICRHRVGVSLITFCSFALSTAMTDDFFYRHIRSPDDLSYSRATRRSSRPTTITTTTTTHTIRYPLPYSRSLEARLAPLDPPTPSLRIRERRRTRYEDPYPHRELLDLDAHNEIWDRRSERRTEALDSEHYQTAAWVAAERAREPAERRSQRSTAGTNYYVDVGDGLGTSSIFHSDGTVTARGTLRQDDGNSVDVILEGFANDDGSISFHTADYIINGVRGRARVNIEATAV